MFARHVGPGTDYWTSRLSCWILSPWVGYPCFLAMSRPSSWSCIFHFVVYYFTENRGGSLLSLSRRSNCKPMAASWACPTLFPGFLSGPWPLALDVAAPHCWAVDLFSVGVWFPWQHGQAWLRSGHYATHVGCESKDGCLNRTNEPILPGL